MSFLWEKSETGRWLVRKTRDSRSFFFTFATVCGVVPGIIGYCVMQLTSSQNPELEERLRRNARPESLKKCIYEAKQLFYEMLREGLNPNDYTYSSLICGLFHARRPWEALEFLKESCGSGYIPNTVTYNTLMHGFCEHGFLDIGLFLFEQMQVNKLKPDMFTYNILIEAMCKAGRFKDAKKLLSRLPTDRLQPNVYTFSIIIDGLSRKGFIDEAYQVFRNMENNGCMPNSCSYNVIIHGFLRQKDLSSLSVKCVARTSLQITPHLCWLRRIKPSWHYYEPVVMDFKVCEKPN